MSDIKKQIFEAIEVIVQEENKKLQFTKTIEAIVHNIEEASSGKYMVKYQDSIFPVYSNDVNLRYDVDDVVLVLIPDGDFSQQKTIIGKKGSAANKLISTLSPIDKINLVGPDWLSSSITGVNDYSGELIELKSGKDENGNDDEIVIFTKLLDIENNAIKLFNSYFKNCEAFLIKADFKTDFSKDLDYYGGNYGIKVTLDLYESEEVIDEYTYVLDLSNMTGDPYDYSHGSTQYVMYAYDKEAFKKASLKEISVFESGFNYREQETPDIFISNIQISFIQESSILENGYSVNIAAPQGNMITTNDITLVPELKFQGISQDIDSVFWFIQDMSIKVGSEGYDSNAGIGWRKIEDESISGNNLVLNNISSIGKSIQSRTQLKVVVLSNEMIFSDTIEVFPVTIQYDFNIEIIYENNLITLTVGPEESLETDYHYVWSKKDASGVNYPLATTTVSHSFNINEVYLYNTFYCSIYDKDWNLLSTVNTVINKIVNEKDFTPIFTGEHFYIYDAAGDIDLNVYQAEHKIGFELYTINGEKQDISSIEWIFPENSLIEPAEKDNSDYLKSQEVYYKIAPKYRVDKTNNTIEVKVTTFEGQELVFQKEISLLKVGNTGTNGTKYAAIISFKDNNTSYVDKNNSEQIAVLNLTLYEDGIITTEYSNSVTWEILGNAKRDNILLKEIEVNSGDYGVIYNDASTADLINAVSAVKVTIKAGDYTLIALKAIPVVFEGQYDNSIDWIDFVEYNPGGEEPSWNQNLYIPKEWQISSEGINGNYFNTDRIRVFSETSLLTGREYFDGFSYDSNYSLIPVDRYENDGRTANVILQNGENKILWPVLFWLNTYGNKNVNGWDGISTSIDEAGSAILTTLVGAGEKDSENKFTGVLMGSIDYHDGTRLVRETGLFGFGKGLKTFSIDSETGNAFFKGTVEAGSGKIAGWIIEGDSLKSGNLSLTGGSSPSIKGPNFKLDNEGGTIGGWTINEWSLSSENASLYPSGGFNFGTFGAYAVNDSGRYVTYLEPTYLGTNDGQVGFGTNPETANFYYNWAGWDDTNSNYMAYLRSDGLIVGKTYQWLTEDDEGKPKWENFKDINGYVYATGYKVKTESGEWIDFSGSGSGTVDCQQLGEGKLVKWIFSNPDNPPQITEVNAQSDSDETYYIYVDNPSNPSTLSIGNLFFSNGLATKNAVSNSDVTANIASIIAGYL